MIVSIEERASRINDALVRPWLIRSLLIDNDPIPMNRLGTSRRDRYNGVLGYFVPKRNCIMEFDEDIISNVIGITKIVEYLTEPR